MRPCGWCCVRFLHRANAKEDFSPRHLVNEKFSLALPCRRLRQADPRPVRHQTLLRRVARPLLSETPLSLLWMRCPRSTLVRGAPSWYRLRRLRLRSTAPRYRNSASVSLLISSRVVPVTCFARDVYQECIHTEIPARNSSTNYFYRTSR